MDELQPKSERKQWHPVVVDGMRYLFGRQLRIEPEHPLALLPTRIDVVMVQLVTGQTLPYPFDHLGATTLFEMDTPGEYTTWASERKLAADGHLYSLKEEIEDTSDVALWLVTSHASDRFLGWLDHELHGIEAAGPGLWAGRVMDSRLYVVHLHELPLSVAALPLLMAYKGPREAEIAAFALEHAAGYDLFMEQLASFHAIAVREVIPLVRHGIDIDVEAYRRLVEDDDVKALIDLLGAKRFIDGIGEEKLIDQIGDDKIIREIGEERIIRGIGEEKVLDRLIADMGAERLRKLLDQKTQNGNNGGSPRP